MVYIYILRCSDNSLYTGYTTDYKRRFLEHLSHKKKGAKYTRAKVPVSVEALWGTDTKSSAMKLEAFIKKLSKSQKEEIIEDNTLLYTKYKECLGDNIYLSMDYEDKEY